MNRFFGFRRNTPPWAVIEHQLGVIIKQQEAMLASLDDILKDVTDESSQIDGLSTLISGLKDQLAAALAGTTLPPATQAKVDAIFAAAEVNRGKIADALNNNAGVTAPPTTPPPAAPAA